MDMKKCVCVTAVCLAVQDLSALEMDERKERSPKWHSAEDIKRLREDFKDAGKLKRHLSGEFETCTLTAGGETTTREGAGFMQVFGVDKKLMRDVLMDIHREALAKAGWEKSITASATTDVEGARMRLLGSILWLGSCAEADTKDHLLDIATDKAKTGRDVFYGSAAIEAYMYCADAQEMRDFLPRFITGDVGGYNPTHAYYIAILAYDHTAGDDVQKRKAIVETVSGLLMKVKDKNVFSEGDRLLAARSKEYAESPQRKIAQQRFSKPPKREE